MRSSELLHPGIHVKRDCLDRYELSVTDAAFALGVSRQALSNLLSGKAGISPEMAIRLDLVFGGGAEIWLQRQLSYGLASARRHTGKIIVHALRDKLPRSQADAR
ncbi:HigA family addiction module antitoxin [Aquabacterium sp.]|uniref:HigA family addiction module antitoxin n=1 Tax=Aquabacterium sp. TaxID=1872578 RepID=UPI003D6D4144